jgi:hypothetical protein
MILTATQKLFELAPLLWQAVNIERSRIKTLILYTGGINMLKNLFDAVEALVRAVIYTLVLVIGLTAAALGAFIVIFLAFRIAQFLWVLIFRQAWL